MRFHIVCHPIKPDLKHVAQITLRDANAPADSDPQITLTWTRPNGHSHFTFKEVAVGNLSISELQGTARMIRAVDSISFERGRDSLLTLNIIDFVNALIGENSTQAVYDARYNRYFAVNSVRKENNIDWLPDVEIEEEAARKILSVSAATEEQARKCITNRLMELIDSDEVSEQAQAILIAWTKVKRKVIADKSVAEAPKAVAFASVYAPSSK